MRKRYPKSPGDAERGKRIRAGRKARHLTQAQLARAVGVIKGTVVRWETGELAPRDHKAKLAEVLGITEQHIDYGGKVTPGLVMFERWLEGAPERELMKPWMRESLRAIPLPRPTVDAYRRIFYTLLAEDPKLDD